MENFSNQYLSLQHNTDTLHVTRTVSRHIVRKSFLLISTSFHCITRGLSYQFSTIMFDFQQYIPFFIGDRAEQTAQETKPVDSGASWVLPLCRYRISKSRHDITVYRTHINHFQFEYKKVISLNIDMLISSPQYDKSIACVQLHSIKSYCHACSPISWDTHS